MDHSNNVVIDAIDFVPETLTGAKIYGDGDSLIGTVSHVHGLGPDSKVVIEVGGFLGLGAKAVMMPVTDMVFMRNDDGSVHGKTRLTKDQVKAMPEHGHEAH